MTTESAAAPKVKDRFRIDAVAMFLYLSVCHAWALTLHPLGKDFSILAGADSELPTSMRRLVALQVGWFGDNPLGYHVLSFALLYACMLAVYAWVKQMHPDGPFWLGTLAATMFMANPVHADGVLHLTSAATLAPALAALVTLYLYGTAIDGGRTKIVLAIIAFALTSWSFPETRGLTLLIPMYEFFVLRPRWQDSVPRAAVFVLLGFVIWAVQGGHLPALAVPLAQSISPLYFIFYPIGFLPETAHQFHAHAWLGWIAVASVAGVVLLIVRAARRPIILFGLLGMLAYRIAGNANHVDPVHLVGGGELLVETALFCAGLTALFKRMMEHPKWKRLIITSTSLLCVLYFALMIETVSAWRHAGAAVEAFQAEAQAVSSRGNATLLLVPDYLYYRGAPMALSEAISFDTQFSDPVRHISLLQLHYDPSLAVALSVIEVGRDEFGVEINMPDPGRFAVWPYTLLHAGDSRVSGDVHAKVDTADDTRMEWSIRYTPVPGVVLMTPFADSPLEAGVIP